jgi:hypothetical protein
VAEPRELQKEFTGIWRDASRDELPPGKVHNLTDYFPGGELGAPLRKRGGYAYHGVTLNSLNASAGQPKKVAVASFQSGGFQVVAIDSSLNRLFDLTNGADRGAAHNSGPLVFYRELLIIPNGAAAPLKYTGSGAPATLGGSPPNGHIAAVYKDRLALARHDGTPNRIYFSGAGNAESWDITNRWLDTSESVEGLAPLRSAMLVFHKGSVERIRGDIPPGSAAANMSLEPLFSEVGLVDYEAVAVADDYAYWADENGVYRTDGVTFTDLTKQGGISSYWRSQFSSVSATGNVALGVWRGYVWVSLQGASDAYVDFLMFDIDKRAWFRFTNIRAYNFATQFGSADELYFSNRDTSSKQIGKLSGIFSPASGVKNDADGDAVAPVLETGLFPLEGQGKKRVRHIYVSHDTRDAASDNPVQTVSYLTDPSSDSYTALSPTLTETTGRERERVAVNEEPLYGVAVKVAQTNASSETRLYALEVDAHPLEGSRR